jgi:single-strand DNA-binding protein
VNRVVLWGNLGKDPELKMSAGGTAVLKFSVATSERRKDQSGNWGEETEWHSCVCFGKRAEGLGSFLSKGTSVLVEGKLRTSSWEDNNGQKRYKTEIVADEVKVTSKKGDRVSAPRQEKAADVADDPTFYPSVIDDGDIPF